MASSESHLRRRATHTHTHTHPTPTPRAPRARTSARCPSPRPRPPPPGQPSRSPVVLSLSRIRKEPCVFPGARSCLSASLRVRVLKNQLSKAEARASFVCWSVLPPSPSSIHTTPSISPLLRGPWIYAQPSRTMSPHSRFGLQAVRSGHKVEGDVTFLARGHGLRLPPLAVPARQRRLARSAQPWTWLEPPPRSPQLGHATPPFSSTLRSLPFCLKGTHCKPDQGPQGGCSTGDPHSLTLYRRARMDGVKGTLTAPGYVAVHPSRSPDLHREKAHSCAGR